jgi:hypothetical protein
LIVMTAGEQEESELPKRLADRARRIWRELQDDYARRSTDSIHLIARYSPHFIQSTSASPSSWSTRSESSSRLRVRIVGCVDAAVCSSRREPCA